MKGSKSKGISKATSSQNLPSLDRLLYIEIKAKKQFFEIAPGNGLDGGIHMKIHLFLTRLHISKLIESKGQRRAGARMSLVVAIKN